MKLKLLLLGIVILLALPILAYADTSCVSLTLIDDTYINRDVPDTNYNTNVLLRMQRGATDIQRAHLTWDIGNLSDKTVVDSNASWVLSTAGANYDFAFREVNGTVDYPTITWNTGNVCGNTPTDENISGSTDCNSSPFLVAPTVGTGTKSYNITSGLTQATERGRTNFSYVVSISDTFIPNAFAADSKDAAGTKPTLYACFLIPPTGDSAPPTIKLGINNTSPLINEDINISVNVTDDTAPIFVNITINFTTGLVIMNYTVSANVDLHNITKITDSAGNVLNVSSCAVDAADNYICTSIKITVASPPDTTPPGINITSPVNDSTITVDFADLNWTINETPVWCAYILDGGSNDTGICNTTSILGFALFDDPVIRIAAIFFENGSYASSSNLSTFQLSRMNFTEFHNYSIPNVFSYSNIVGFGARYDQKFIAAFMDNGTILNATISNFSENIEFTGYNNYSIADDYAYAQVMGIGYDSGDGDIYVYLDDNKIYVDDAFNSANENAEFVNFGTGTFPSGLSANDSKGFIISDLLNDALLFLDNGTYLFGLNNFDDFTLHFLWSPAPGFVIRNITLSSLSAGLHNVTIWANDSAGNMGQSLYTYWTVSTDTCTYSSGDWTIAASDNCIISSVVDVGGNSVSVSGTGSLTIISSGKIQNFDKFAVHGSASVTCRNTGGCFG